jgi:hypothetical protein
MVSVPPPPSVEVNQAICNLVRLVFAQEVGEQAQVEYRMGLPARPVVV